MKCHDCPDQIEHGQAMIQIPAPGGYHYWFFHPECFTRWNDAQELALLRINNVRHLAGLTH